MSSHILRMFGQSGYSAGQRWFKLCQAMCQPGTGELERLLTTLKLDPNASYQTALHDLMTDVHKRNQVQDYLCTDTPTLCPLQLSILTQNVAACQMMLQMGADIRIAVKRRPANSLLAEACPPICSPLHLSVLVHDCRVLRLLIDQTAGDVNLLNVRDMFQLTPLDQAVRTGALSCAKLLIASGARIAMDENNASVLTVCDLIDGTGFDFQLIHTILDLDYSSGGDILSHFMAFSCSTGDSEHKFTLIDRIIGRADFWPSCRSGVEASGYMHMAAAECSERLVRTLSAAGVVVESNLMDENPLHVAVRQHRTTRSLIQCLISMGCDKNQVNVNGNSPLAEAILCLNTSSILYLMAEGCEYHVTWHGYSALHLYLNGGGTAVSVIKKLALISDVKAVMKHKWTALHLLIDRCEVSNQTAVIAAMNALIELGADPEAQNSAGDTVLTIAALRSLDQVMREFLLVPDDPLVQYLNRTPDSTGNTALHIAILNPAMPLDSIKGLIAAGADVNARDSSDRNTLFLLLMSEFVSSDGFFPFRWVLNRRNIFQHKLLATGDRTRKWDILQYIIKETEVDVNCPLTGAIGGPIDVALSRGQYVLAQMLMPRADGTQVRIDKLVPGPGMLNTFKHLFEKGFQDFDPLVTKLSEVLSDTFGMRSLTIQEQQELHSLSALVNSLKQSTIGISGTHGAQI